MISVYIRGHLESPQHDGLSSEGGPKRVHGYHVPNVAQEVGNLLHRLPRASTHVTALVVRREDHENGMLKDFLAHRRRVLDALLL